MQALKIIILKAATFGAAFGSVSYASPPAAPPQSVSVAASPTTSRIPAGTVVELEFVEPLSSKTSITGQTFALRLRQPIVIDGQTAIPAGIMGGGEVIDAARAGTGGKSGKLIVSGRYLDVQGQRIRIRGLQSVLAGEDRSRTAVNTVMLVPYVGILGALVQGGDIEIASGTPARALLATDLVVSIPSPSMQPETSTTPSSHSTTPTGKSNP